jgi:hypothetical protein
MLFFVIERLWTGRLFQEPAGDALVPVSLE